MYQGNLETDKDQEIENIIPDFYENIVIIDTSKVFHFQKRRAPLITPYACDDHAQPD